MVKTHRITRQYLNSLSHVDDVGIIYENVKSRFISVEYNDDMLKYLKSFYNEGDDRNIMMEDVRLSLLSSKKTYILLDMWKYDYYIMDNVISFIKHNEDNNLFYINGKDFLDYCHGLDQEQEVDMLEKSKNDYTTAWETYMEKKLKNKKEDLNQYRNSLAVNDEPFDFDLDLKI